MISSYDQQWAPLISTPHDSVGEDVSELISFRIPAEMTVLEDEQPVRFDPAVFDRIEHVKISFTCQKDFGHAQPIRPTRLRRS